MPEFYLIAEVDAEDRDLLEGLEAKLANSCQCAADEFATDLDRPVRLRMAQLDDFVRLQADLDGGQPYTRFCELIRLSSRAEQDWIEAQLGPDSSREWQVGRELGEDDERSNGFEYEFQLVDVDHARLLKIYSSQYGDPEWAAHFLHEFLRQFHPDRAIHLSYSHTSSRLRPGLCTGGGYMITAAEIKHLYAPAWLHEQLGAAGFRLGTTLNAG